MYLVYGLWLLSLLQHPILQCMLTVVLILKLKSYGHYLEICILLYCVIVFMLSAHSFATINNRFVVQSIYDEKVVLRQGIHRFDYYGEHGFSMGDNVYASEVESYQEYNKLKSLGRIHEDKIEKVEKSRGYKSLFWSKLGQYPQLSSFFSRELDSIFSVLSLQLWGFLKLFEFIYRFFYSKKNMNFLKIILCIFYGYLFGINFGFIRIFLQLLLKDRNKVIVILLLLYPYAALSPGFYLVYLPYLLKHLYLGFHNIDLGIFQKALLLRALGKLNILEVFLFKALSYFAGLMVWLGVFMQFWIGQSLLKSMMFLLNQPRFLLVGAPSILWFYLFLTQNKKSQIITFMLMVVFNMYYPFFRLSMIQVYQGDATLITFPFNAYTVLIDTGKPSVYTNLKTNLYKMGIKKIDTLIITHPDLDHNGNQDVIIEEFKIDKIIERKDESHPFFKLLLSDMTYEDANENSLILYFEVYQKKVLIMGDAGTTQEKEIVNRYPGLKVDILKLGHHGSNTSNSEVFLSKVRPQIALISSDPRIYNHPHPDVMYRLQQFGVFDFQTSKEGTVTFIIYPFLSIVVSEAQGFGIMK